MELNEDRWLQLPLGDDVVGVLPVIASVTLLYFALFLSMREVLVTSVSEQKVWVKRGDFMVPPGEVFVTNVNRSTASTASQKKTVMNR